MFLGLIKIIKNSNNNYNNIRTMTTVTGKEVLSKLNELIPLKLAEKWDNVGLLVEPSNTDQMEIDSIFLTNDLTEPVLQEAINEKAKFILSYHPPLFNQFKTVNQKSIPQRIAIKAIENKIPVYSPHSALDSCVGGLNDWIAQGLLNLNNGKGSVKPIIPFSDSSKTSQKVTIYTTNQLDQQSLDQLKQNSTFFYNSELNKIELSCTSQQLPIISDLINNLKSVSNWDITNQEKVPSLIKGQGKLVTLEQGVDIDVIVKGVKELFKIQYIRLGKPLVNTEKRIIKTISLCAGSGGALIFNEKADLYLTGELTHHVILDACAKGSYVIVCDHTNSERGYLTELKSKLEHLFDNRIKVIISKLDTDPLQVL